MAVDQAKLQEVLPAYFALASSNWSLDRRNVDEDEWEELLSSNNLTAEEFDRFEGWWFGAKGSAVLEKLKMQFIESIVATAIPDARELLKDYFEELNWRDFIREASDCMPGQGPYFIEYAVEQGLCWPVNEERLEEFDLDQEIINELLELWFEESHEVIQEILLTPYTEITKVK